jgi:hypothetical protein
MAYRFYLLFQGTSGWELVVSHTPSSMFSKFFIVSLEVVWRFE